MHPPPPLADLPREGEPLPEAAARVASFLASVRQAVEDRSFESLVLSKNRDGGAGPTSIRVRHVGLRSGEALSFVSSHATRDLTRNVDLDSGFALIAALLDRGGRPSFAHATLHATGADLQLMISRRGQASVRRLPRAPARRQATAAATAARTPDAGDPAAPAAGGAPAVAALPAHDRRRERRLAIDAPFLVELGITDAGHRLVPSMARKWRQIDKFLEVLDDALDALPTASLAAATTGTGVPIRVVDYGCGKGYLTFAVHRHLERRFGVGPRVTGVELRPELVDFCNAVATRCGCSGLAFVAGDLRTFVPEAVDVMIALHACDTATDHALDLGLRAGAAVLICSPCCHKEVRPQMAGPRALSGLLRHGIHVGQEAEMVTDSLRALLLESCGYEARVFEFVSLEHTSKNKMIVATRRAAAGDSGRALAEVRDLKGFYGIREQCLETLLERRAAASRSGAAQACQTP